MEQGKHWIGHIKTSFEGAKFWENKVTLMHFSYINVQEEIGQGGMQHYQFYFVLKQKKRKNWLLKHIHKDAFYELKRGSVAEAIDYVSKEDTRVPDGVQFEYGELPTEQSGKAVIRKRDEVIQGCCEVIQKLKKREYIRPEDIDDQVLLYPSFPKVYSLLTANILGPDRVVNIFCMIGPRGTGKSEAYKHNVREEDRAIIKFNSNGQAWGLQADRPTLILDEYVGRAGVDRELNMLDGTANVLELKHGFAPALYTNVIICSNKPPTEWHTGGLGRKLQLHNAQAAGIDIDDFTATPEQNNALYDRLGIFYGQRGFDRTCGHYVEIDSAVNENLAAKHLCWVFLQEWLKQGLAGKLPPGNFKDYAGEWTATEIPPIKDLEMTEYSKEKQAWIDTVLCAKPLPPPGMDKIQYNQPAATAAAATAAAATAAAETTAEQQPTNWQERINKLFP